MLPPSHEIPERAVTAVGGPPARPPLTSEAVVPEAPTSPAPRRGWLTPRRLAVLLGVWVVAAGGALLLANALDSPVGEGARDEAQAVAPGPAAVPPGAAAAGGSLPPLALVLDAPLPENIAGLPPVEQARRLTELARDDPGPRRLVELGSVLQQLGNAEGAAIAFREAARRDPDDLAARAGLAMNPGVGGGAGLARAAAGLDRLAREDPGDQLVAFNQGWVEVYRRRAGPAAEAWQRTVALGADTRLGQTATALLQQLAGGG
jgi:hypothetical protein